MSEKRLINLTYHSKLRYIQRVLEKEDESLAEKYLSDNNLNVSLGLWKLFSKTKLYYKNFPTNENVSVHIYIYKDILFIVSQDYSIVTLWKLKGKDARIHKNVIKKLYENMHSISKFKYESVKTGKEGDKIEYTIGKLDNILSKVRNSGEEYSISIIEEEVKLLQEELSKTIESEKSIVSKERDLKRESKDIMKSVMYGYIDEINQFYVNKDD